MPRQFYPKLKKINERTQAIRFTEGERKGEIKTPPYVIEYECKKCTLVIVNKIPKHLINWWGGAFKELVGTEIEAIEVITHYKSTIPIFKDRTKLEYQYNKNGVAETWNAKKDKKELVPPLKIDKDLIKEVCY